MRFAILGDIHGNIFAFKTAIQKIETLDIDAIILCGDYITDLVHTKEVLQLIKDVSKKYKSYIIKGNREEYILKMHKLVDKSKWKESNIFENTAYTYFDLIKEDIDFLLNIPNELIIEIDNLPSIYVSHELETDKKYDYKIFGHEHMQLVFSSRGITYINPGSIGLPITSFPGTTNFTILDLTEHEHNIQNFSIKYDISKAIESISTSRMMNFPNEWGKNTIMMIESGIDFCWLQVQATKNNLTLEELINDVKFLNDINFEISDVLRKKLGI